MSTAAKQKRSGARLPPSPVWLQSGFHAYLGRYLRKHFDVVGWDCGGANAMQLSQRCDGNPLVVYTNHPSWWDPIVAHLINAKLFAPRQFRAPIDADALEQYRVFKKLGFFGIQTGTRRGAADFISTGSSVLSSTKDVLWITPEGRFADPRDHSATLMPGLSHLCAKASDGNAIPMAMEYAFWDERLPVCVVRFGEPMSLASSSDKPHWRVRLDEQLRTTQVQLAETIIKRDLAPIIPIIKGHEGGGWFYDSFRRLRAKLSGRSFVARHGSAIESGLSETTAIKDYSSDDNVSDDPAVTR